MFATTHPDGRNPSADGKATTDFTAVIMILIRLAQESTDLMITINIPHVQGQYEPHEISMEDGRTGGLINEGQKIRDQVISSFQIKDWGLFGR